MLEHDVDHAPEVVVQEVDKLFGLHLLRKRGKAGDVGIQHRHAQALAGQKDFVAVGVGQHPVRHLLVDVALERLAQEVRMLVVLFQLGVQARVVDCDRREVGDGLQELFVLLLEDAGAKRVVDINGADDVPFNDKRCRDDGAQVVEDHGLLAFEPIIEAGISCNQGAAAHHDLFHYRPRAEELAGGVVGLLASRHPDLELVALRVDQHDESARGVHQVDDAVHDPAQHLVQVEG